MGCIASMLDLARLTDECLTLDILQLLGKSGVDKLILECPAEPDLWDQEGASPHVLRSQGESHGAFPPRRTIEEVH